MKRNIGSTANNSHRPNKTMSDSPTRLIKLTGRHATGKHRLAVVDADLFDELNRYAWKVKWNGRGKAVYAVRNAREGGRVVTLRLHRVVLGVPSGSPGDVRFMNKDTLDCRRANLKHCNRSETTRAARVVRQHARCIECGCRFAFWKAGYAKAGFCSGACRASHKAEQHRRARARKPRALLVTKPCDQCHRPFLQATPWQRFCGESCKKKARYQRRRCLGSPRAKTIEGQRGAIFR